MVRVVLITGASRGIGAATGKGPRISVARAGLTVSWGPRFQSLLELAEACDVPVR